MLGLSTEQQIKLLDYKDVLDQGQFERELETMQIEGFKTLKKQIIEQNPNFTMFISDADLNDSSKFDLNMTKLETASEYLKIDFPDLSDKEIEALIFRGQTPLKHKESEGGFWKKVMNTLSKYNTQIIENSKK